jgi:hypothetical protein
MCKCTACRDSSAMQTFRTLKLTSSARTLLELQLHDDFKLQQSLYMSRTAILFAPKSAGWSFLVRRVFEDCTLHVCRSVCEAAEV